MLKLGTTSKLSNEAIVERAVKYFGPGGLGLKVVDKDQCCVTFEGAGGKVEVTLSSIEKGTAVDVVSQEWDTQVKEFVNQLAH